MMAIDAVMSMAAAAMISGIAKKDTANWDTKFGASVNTFAMSCLVWLVLRVWWLNLQGGNI